VFGFFEKVDHPNKKKKKNNNNRKKMTSDEISSWSKQNIFGIFIVLYSLHTFN